MNQTILKTEHTASPDYALMIAGLEAKLLAGTEQQKCRQILAREDIIRQLRPDQALAWAELAQLAGDVPLALSILESLNKTAPTLSSAWIKRVELLTMLGTDKHLGDILKQAESYLDQAEHRRLNALVQHPAHVLRNETDTKAAGAPFQHYRDRQECLNYYLRCFSGREDCFARQWTDKNSDKHGYMPVRRAFTAEDLEEHLSGRKTYGIYLLRKDAAVYTTVIDVDLNKQFRTSPPPKAAEIVKRERDYLFSRIQECSAALGLSPVAEFSGGKGYHFWFLFEQPIPASTARRVINGVINGVAKDLQAFNLELFPKQETFSGKGLGNLVKLPLGIHRLTGKSSYFIDCRDRRVQAQLRYLMGIQRSKVKDIKPPAPPPPAPVITYPAADKEAGKYPELARLKQSCPPLAQMMAVCQSGQSLSFREEKIMLQTIGLLPRARLLMHYLWAPRSDYDPHLLNSKLSHVRGTPLGCKRIHSLLGYDGPLCSLEQSGKYGHPLLLLDDWNHEQPAPAKTIVNLTDAINHLKQAIIQVERFLIPA